MESVRTFCLWQESRGWAGCEEKEDVKVYGRANERERMGSWRRERRGTNGRGRSRSRSSVPQSDGCEVKGGRAETREMEVCDRTCCLNLECWETRALPAKGGIHGCTRLRPSRTADADASRSAPAPAPALQSTRQGAKGRRLEQPCPVLVESVTVPSCTTTAHLPLANCIQGLGTLPCRIAAHL